MVQNPKEPQSVYMQNLFLFNYLNLLFSFEIFVSSAFFFYSFFLFPLCFYFGLSL